MLIVFILSDGHFINKMLFGPTLFSQNYPDDPVGETKVRKKKITSSSLGTHVCVCVCG